MELFHYMGGGCAHLAGGNIELKQQQKRNNKYITK